jgi:hypothetical protein
MAPIRCQTPAIAARPMGRLPEHAVASVVDMARRIRDAQVRREGPGQKPLLQGHLRPGAVTPRPAGDDVPPEASGQPGSEPATEVTNAASAVARGKATRSPAEVATRRNLEGSEQGPV